MMNSERIFVLLALLALLSLGSGHIGGQTSLQELQPRIYCGRDLALIMAVLCYDDGVNKRSETGSMYNSILSPYYKDQESDQIRPQFGWPLMSPHKAQGMDMGMAPRGKRYIVDECCMKSCTTSELMAYC